MAKRRAEIEVTLRDRATAGLKRLGSGFSVVTKGIGLVTAAASTLTAILGARFLVGAIRSAGEFDEAMSRVAAVTGASAEELQRLRESADQAGTTTRFTATAAANGLEELARAGQNANEAIETLNPALQLAAGNNQSVAESAIQITTALNAFGLAADESARVSDVFTRAAQRSAQTTGQLADAMTFVAPVARQAGLDIEETAALVGRLADQGFRGSLGGTALRNAILQLQDPTSAFRRELANLGIESDDFIEVLGELADAGKDGEAAIRSLGLRAGPAIQALVAGGKPAIEELVAELRNAQGASAAAAAQLENNLPGALRGLQSAFDAARRRLAEPLVERLTADIQRFTGVVQDFVKSDQLTQLRDVLASTFDAAREAVRQFIGGIDFQDVIRRIQEFADSAQQRLADFTESARGFAQGWNKTVGAIEVGAGIVRTAFNGLGIVIASALKVATEAFSAFTGFLRVTSFGASSFLNELDDEVKLVSESISDSIRKFVDGAADGNEQIARGFERFNTQAQAAASQIERAFDQRDSIESGVTEPLETAQERLKRIGDEADRVRATWDEYAAAAERAATSTRRTLDELRQEAEAARTPFERLNQAIREIESEADIDPLIEQLDTLRASGEITVAEFERLRGAIIGAADALGEGAAPDIEAVGNAGRRAAEGVEQIGVAADNSARRASSASQLISGVLDSWRGLSESASDAVNQFLADIGRGANTVAGFFSRLAGFTRGLREEQERQVDEFGRLVDELERVGDAQGGLLRAQALLNREVQLLDSSQVERLQRAMEAARQATESTRQETADFVRGLEDDLLRLQGRTDEIEARRLQNQRDQIRLQLASNELDTESRANLQRSLSLLDEIENTRRQQAAETQAQAEAGERSADAAEREADAIERANRVDRQTGPRRVEVDIRTTASETGAPNFTQADLANLANLLTPLIVQRLRGEERTGL